MSDSDSNPTKPKQSRSPQHTPPPKEPLPIAKPATIRLAIEACEVQIDTITDNLRRTTSADLRYEYQGRLHRAKQRLSHLRAELQRSITHHEYLPTTKKIR